MSATLSARIRRSAARATLELPFSVPAKEMFSLREAARIMELSESFVEKLYDQGNQLSGHSHNAGNGQRMTKRIPRVWLVAYMIRTAHYDDSSLGDALIACLTHLPTATLLRIAAAATHTARENPLGARRNSELRAQG